MNYQDTIHYLFTRLPMFSRIGAPAYKADLVNTIKLCEYLGNPQNKFRSIHVAGTNGKGSVSHMLAAILQTAGLKTGLYTSPHLKDFRERIKINGEMIPEKSVIAFTEKIKNQIEEIDPSFFEITVAMAFDYFEKQEVDIAVIEVGLGGRLDSTNIITPELAVITNIGWDHMNFLGDSLEKIAAEKAGIIKKEIPVVIGEFLPETKPVFEKIALEKKAPIHFASKKRFLAEWKFQHHELEVAIEEQSKIDHRLFHLDLSGFYQIKNLITVLEAVSVLKKLGFNLPDDKVYAGLKKTKKITGLHGRWEIVHLHPAIVLDVAHNEEGFKQVAQQIEITDYQKLHIILGMVMDKEVKNLIRHLPQSAEYYFTQSAIPRALPAVVLKEKGTQLNLMGKVYANVNEALLSAKANATSNDLILVCGSVFLAGEVNLPIH